MGIKFTIKTDLAEITQGIRNSVRTHLNTALSQATMDIKREVQSMITSLLTGDETYKSLLSGQLQAEFGLENPQPILEEILTILRGSVEVSFSPMRSIGTILQGEMTIYAIKDDFSDILSSSAASYMSGPFKIEWLDWLLTQGDTILIANYRVDYNLTASERAASRTGVALMKAGGGWKVPAQYSGILSDNFITRIFNNPSLENTLSGIVEKSVSKHL